MEMYNIIYELDKLISQNHNIGLINEYNDETDLISDCDYDSLSIIQLVVQIEETFQIELPDEFLDLDYLRSYSWWKKYLIGISKGYRYELL